MGENNNQGSLRDIHLAKLKDAILQGNQELWRKRLRKFIHDYGNDDRPLPDILDLAEEIAPDNPDAATDLITNGVLKKYIRVVITDSGYAVLKKSDTDEPLRERAAKTLLSLSAGQMSPQKSIFAAWVAALNLDPETAAGKVAADQAFQLGKDLNSPLIPAMARSIIALHEDPVTIKEAVELWQEKLSLLSLQRRIDEISKLSQLSTKLSGAPNLSREWKKAMGELLKSSSPITVFNEAEKLVLDPDTSDSLRMTAARYWENVIDAVYSQAPLAAVDIAEQTHTKMNKTDNIPDNYRDIVVNKLMEFSQIKNSMISCQAIFAAADYRGRNPVIIDQVRTRLENVIDTQNLGPELSHKAENKLKAFNRRHKPSDPDPGSNPSPSP